MVEVLKQGPYSPVPIEKQVVIIYAGANGYLDDIPASDVVKFESELMPFVEAKYSNLLEAIRTEKKISDESDELLKTVLSEFKSTFVVK
jgi:F-type H+-transporting ATPase subunit alpha